MSFSQGFDLQRWQLFCVYCGFITVAFLVNAFWNSFLALLNKVAREYSKTRLHYQMVSFSYANQPSFMVYLWLRRDINRDNIVFFT